MKTPLLLLPLLLLLLATAAPAQPATRPGQLTPDHVDVPYDHDDPAQVLDVYLAKSAGKHLLPKQADNK